MKKLIENFPNQMKEALTIGNAYSFKNDANHPKNVLICGLGGSGIGGSFIQNYTFDKIAIPLSVNKGYHIPAFVDENTLVIISSYSGNTEETLNCLQQALDKNARIVAISSNGEVMKKAEEHGFDLIQIPGGMPPRSCFAYSLTQLFFILNQYQLINDSFKNELTNAIDLIECHIADIQAEALTIAEKIYDKIPILYSVDSIEAVTVRWRQQINENGKQLCWHHVVPEMNHNELVGWREKNNKLAVLLLRNKTDYERNQKRIELNKTIFAEYTDTIIEVWSKGNSYIERAFYLVMIGDWLSYYLSEKRGFDATEVKVIDALKSNLKD